MTYRLGLDLGTNSIGWCLLELDATGRPAAVEAAGVRILTPNEEAGRDPQSKASLAADRRAARAMRRRRDRFLRRQKRLMETLIEAGLMPAEIADRKTLEKIDPYWLRAEALDRRLSLHELGRAIFHINQRRGFKSNRIADGGDNEDGAVKAGMAKLNAALEESGARTLGELLANRHSRDRDGYRVDSEGARVGARNDNPHARAEVRGVRFRPRAEGAKNLYDFYPSRDMTEGELDAIWAVQKKHHPQLTDDLLVRLKRIIVEQRPLKKPVVGRCTLRPEPGEQTSYGLKIDMGERAPKAHPLFQRFRILQDISQLRIKRPGLNERPLTMQEFKALVSKLSMTGESACKFENLRKELKLPDDARFNYELSGRSGFKPDETAVKLRSKKAFGRAWDSLDRDRQIELVEHLLQVEDPEALITWLMERHGLSEEQAEAVSGTRLPQGHGQFGRSVLADLVEVMESRSEEDGVDPQTGEIYARPLKYNEATQAFEEQCSHRRASGGLPKLPYYGEALRRHVISKPDAPTGSQESWGRVPNPTVHIGLNQLRAVVNTLIDTYGQIDEIVVELARELKLKKQRRDEIERENRENEKKNADRRERLAKLGMADTHDARLRLRLFDELPADEKVCVYSGAALSVERLFDGSVDIDHILPHSSTLDDSFMNKVLCTAHANREKGKLAPASAWSGERLQEIEERARRLFPRKAWRFSMDAMTRFDAEGGFLARQLTDTQHMARMAKTYLEQVCKQVWAPPGRLTAMLRAKWGLNDILLDHNFTNPALPKNRKDHRHHAIDAFVVACTDRGLLNRMARASGQAEDLNLDRLYPNDSFPEPWDGYRDELRAVLDRVVVSHKPDHGLAPGNQDNPGVTSGQLLEETAYGLVDEEIDGKRYNLVTRKPVNALTSSEIQRVRDKELRVALQAVEYKAKQSGQKLEDALAAFGEAKGIRRVRILKTEQSVRVIRHGAGFEKAYTPAGNHRIEIYELPDGSWSGEGVSVFDANQPGFKPQWRQRYPGAKLVMRVHNGDLIEADFGTGRDIYRVYQLRPSANLLVVAKHSEAGSLAKRHADDTDPFRQSFPSYTALKSAAARIVRVDPIGRVSYPEPR